MRVIASPQGVIAFPLGYKRTKHNIVLITHLTAEGEATATTAACRARCTWSSSSDDTVTVSYVLRRVTSKPRAASPSCSVVGALLEEGYSTRPDPPGTFGSSFEKCTAFACASAAGVHSAIFDVL